QGRAFIRSPDNRQKGLCEGPDPPLQSSSELAESRKLIHGYLCNSRGNIELPNRRRDLLRIAGYAYRAPQAPSRTVNRVVGTSLAMKPGQRTAVEHIEEKPLDRLS